MITPLFFPFFSCVVVLSLVIMRNLEITNIPINQQMFLPPLLFLSLFSTLLSSSSLRVEKVSLFRRDKDDAVMILLKRGGICSDDRENPSTADVPPRT